MKALVIAALCCVSSATAQVDIDARPNLDHSPGDTIDRSRYTERIDVLSIGADYVASAGGESFFEEYSKLGSNESYLGTYLAPVITARIALSESVRIVGHTAYHAARVAETYDVRDVDDSRVPPSAVVSENLSLLAVPLIGGIEFAPIQSQFTSYVGIGAGLAVTKARWTSTVLTSTGGYVRPQRNTDGFGLAPAARAYAGVDLRFDRSTGVRSTFRGIFLEAAFTLMPIARDYFLELRSRGQGIDEGPARDDATLYVGGLSFTFGLNLQLLRP